MLTPLSVCHDVDMSQVELVGQLDKSVGYVLKQATVALRTAMDAGLRPFELSVAQYVSLELLQQRPGLSNAELAREAFVSRQSMNLVLRGLQQRGLITRPDTADHGRARPIKLTPPGRRLWRDSSIAVRAIEKAMLAPFSAAHQTRLLNDLTVCAAAVSGADSLR